MTRLLTDHIALRHGPQIFIDDLKQLVSGSFITSEPFVQEVSDISPCHGINSGSEPKLDERLPVEKEAGLYS